MSFRLIVAGAGTDERALRSSLERSVPGGELEWKGPLPASAVSDQVYQQADVLLLTSRWETGPIVAWEAMAHGLVVVSSRYVGSGREAVMVHRENSLMFEVGDIEAAVCALTELAEDRGLLSRLSAASRQTIEDRYTTERSIASWDEALRAAAQAPLRALTAPRLRHEQNRLARRLGPALSERLRGLRRKLPPDRGPGGEWPHTLGGTGSPDQFWLHARGLDGVEPPPHVPARLAVSR